MISFDQALETVRHRMSGIALNLATESVPLLDAQRRVLAETVHADRDYPPFHRSTRDGYALRSSDIEHVPVTLRCVGEARAGKPYEGKMPESGACVEIMTGAPLPAGTDAVLMLEYARRRESGVEALRSVGPNENVVCRGSEARSGAVVLDRGRRLDSGAIGLLASIGFGQVSVFRRPRVAVLPTGDEVVPLDQQPRWFEVRNSNGLTLAAAVSDAGATPRLLGIAPDDAAGLRRLIERGLDSDLLLLSGGVSAGKYDLVEQVLGDLGAEFYFQSVALRPGKPLVFGRVQGKFWFGLPGNPVSTFVTFELFVRPALTILAGGNFEGPVVTRARLGQAFRQKTGLTTFMPARVEMRDREPVVSLVGWQGSGDLVGLASANCLLMMSPEQTEVAAGEWAGVVLLGRTN
jgi:molybdopterin molybdotransferase